MHEISFGLSMSSIAAVCTIISPLCVEVACIVYYGKVAQLLSTHSVPVLITHSQRALLTRTRKVAWK
jgi:hypothetical protein